MLLGKRRGPAIRRTTSQAELGAAPESPRDQRPQPRRRQRRATCELPPPPPLVVDTAQFLKACGLCKRLLGPGRDTFMYRGDIAFCSLECRQQHMCQDERKEKCLLTSIKMDTPPSNPDTEASAGSGTVAAA